MRDLAAIGAARGIRTPDPLITNEVLYQLSYCGISMSYFFAFAQTRHGRRAKYGDVGAAL
jgi:hypothetical protein